MRFRSTRIIIVVILVIGLGTNKLFEVQWNPNFSDLQFLEVPKNSKEKSLRSRNSTSSVSGLINVVPKCRHQDRVRVTQTKTKTLR